MNDVVAVRTLPFLRCARPYVGDFGDGPAYFCCACNLEIMGTADPDCDCGVCSAERRRGQIEALECGCEACVAEWRRATTH
jgi:hypothetical protein